MKKATKIFSFTVIAFLLIAGSALAIALGESIVNQTISEPVSMILLGAGLITLGGFGRKSLRAQSRS